MMELTWVKKWKELVENNKISIKELCLLFDDYAKKENKEWNDKIKTRHNRSL